MSVTSSQYPYQAKLEIRTFLTSSQYPYQAKLEIRTFLMTSGKFCRSQII